MNYQDEQQKIVHFRVLQVEPNPLPPMLRTHTDQIILTYENLTAGCQRRCSLTEDQYAPYRAALAEAIRASRVYWADWNFAWIPGSSIPTGSRLQRLLDAVKHDQVVAPE